MIYVVYLKIFMEIIVRKKQQQVFWLVVFSVKCVKYRTALHMCNCQHRWEGSKLSHSLFTIVISSGKKYDVSNQDSVKPLDTISVSGY